MSTQKKRVFLGALFLLCLGSFSIFLFRKTLLEWFLNSTLESLLPFKVVLRVKDLSSNQTSLTLEIPDCKTTLEGIKISWTIARLFSLESDISLHYEGDEINCGSVHLMNLSLHSKAHLKVSTFKTFSLNASLSEMVTSQLSLNGIQVELSENPSGLQALALAHDTHKRKYQIQFEGSSLLTPPTPSSEGKLLIEIPAVHSSGRVNFRSDGQFNNWLVVAPALSVDFNSLPDQNYFGHRLLLSLSAQSGTDQAKLSLTTGPFQNKWFETLKPLQLDIHSKPSFRDFEFSLRPHSSDDVFLRGKKPFSEFYVNHSLITGRINLNKDTEQLNAELKINGIRIGPSASNRPRFSMENLSANVRLNASEELVLEVQAMNCGLALINLYPQKVFILAKGPLSNIKIKGSLEDMLGQAWLQGEGTFDLNKLQGNFSLEKSFDFSTMASVLENVSGMVGEKFQPKTGRLSLNAGIKFAQGKIIDSFSHVLAQNLVLNWDGIPLQTLNGIFSVKSLFPLVLGKNCGLSIETMGEKLPLKDLTLRFEQNQKNQIMVTGLKATWSGGKISSSDFPIQLLPPEFSTTVSVENINLENVFSAIDMDNLKAKGTVSGKLPVKLKDGELIIENGTLSSHKQDGWVQYKDPTLYGIPEKITYLDQFQTLVDQGHQALVFKALDNFYFTEFDVQFSRTPEKGLEPRITMAGHNPDLGNGIPFKFNISLSGQVEKAVKESLLRGMLDPEAFAEKFGNLK